MDTGYSLSQVIQHFPRSTAWRMVYWVTCADCTVHYVFFLVPELLRLVIFGDVGLVLFFFFSFVLGFVLVGVFSLFFSGGSSGLGLTRRRWWDSVGRRMEFPSLLVFISLLARDFGLELHLRIVAGSDLAFVGAGGDRLWTSSGGVDVCNGC